jgi:hypothetical protein
VYAAGPFTHMNGQARNGFAAVDSGSGALSGWDPAASNAPFSYFANAVAVGSSAVYLGGSFTQIGGASRDGLAAVDPATGAATSWDPEIVGADSTTALAVNGSTLYAGMNPGLNVLIGGLPRRGDFAAFNIGP